MRTSLANWRKPLAWNRKAEEEGKRYKVFCASLADVFEAKEAQQGELNRWREELGGMIEQTPCLDWLLLTKRPQNVNHLAQYMFDSGLPSNVWIGTSVENQEQADARIPELLKIPARVRFISAEPLLGPIDLTNFLANNAIFKAEFWNQSGSKDAIRRADGSYICCTNDGVVYRDGVDIRWVIVGGESGTDARPFGLDWAHDIIEQCQWAGIPCFVKQMGSRPYASTLAKSFGWAMTSWDTTERDKYWIKLMDKKGGDMSEWPQGLQVRQFPQLEGGS